MAKLRGVTWEIYDVTGTPAKIPNITDCQLNVAASTFDASDHDSGAWGEKMTGTWQWTATVSAWYNDGDTEHQALRTAAIAGTVLSFEFRPNGTGSGKTKFSGTGRVSQFKLGGPQNAPEPMDFTIEGVGALTEGTQT